MIYSYFRLVGAALVASVAAIAWGQGPGGAAGAARPNVILIVSDDHSAPHLGAYGFPVATPHFDHFAAAGMLFDRMFTTAPQCAPSRASFATGRSPVAAQATRFTAGVPRHIEMFPEALRREAGYFTGIIRRSHHLDPVVDPKKDVTRRIVDEHRLETIPDRFDHVDMGGTHADTHRMLTGFLGARPADRPFFLWLNLNDPHHPWNAPRSVDPARIPLPADLPDTPEMRDDFARHLDEVSRMDTELRLILEELDRRGLDDKTLVIFVGDNGAGIPRGKGSLYDRGLRVPLIVRWPGRVAPGGRSASLISGEDLAPTILEAAGIRPPPAMTGRSFLPVLLGGSQSIPREHVFAIRGVHSSAVLGPSSHSNGVDLGRAVRSSRYKLIVNYTPWIPYGPVDCGRDPGWMRLLDDHKHGRLDPALDALYFRTPRPFVELYDLETDPAEIHNLAGLPEFAPTERQLKEALQEKMITDYDYLPLPL